MVYVDITNCIGLQAILTLKYMAESAFTVHLQCIDSVFTIAGLCWLKKAASATLLPLEIGFGNFR